MNVDFVVVINPLNQAFLVELPREGNGNPLQYSCLENPMDREAWCPWSHKESDTTEQLHSLTHMLKRLILLSEIKEERMYCLKNEEFNIFSISSVSI